MMREKERVWEEERSRGKKDRGKGRRRKRRSWGWRLGKEDRREKGGGKEEAETGR